MFSDAQSSEPAQELSPVPSFVPLAVDPVDPVDLTKSDLASTTVKAVSAVPEVQNLTSSANPPTLDPTVKPTTVGAPVISESKLSSAIDSWANLFKGSSKKLEKKGTSFTLPSGEACVTIPNSVIEKNRKSWEFFILGQFYSDPPSQGTIHNIVNGIWSMQYRDVTISKMDGNAFLFRIPNSATRNIVLTQRLWQIEGQTMFVANWEPGFVPTKPELASAPVWLELCNVPFQFFNEYGLEHIAGLVGDPKSLHPTTTNKTNLEVAKVFTIIDSRKPLPEVAIPNQRRVKAKQKHDLPVLNTSKEKGPQREIFSTVVLHPGQSTLGTESDIIKGESSVWTVVKSKEPPKLQAPDASQSEVDSDSSDIISNESQKGSEESSDHQGYPQVSPKGNKKKKKGSRGKGPKPT
ncbi:hypothetical protein AALP_AA5G057300 [Arabis alpina]|uniref:DUF4283 domain-containing protein n=1 Tax=Arabis alpina TaxID=50452 RepID=A0A087GV63_ARAAL|nr:hypothetical protein AALP_AA5G057300 [Arabis alpina]